ncbi:MAG: molybdopterin oxidoreductase family protein [Acidimicrobiia bacterium]
MKSPRARATAQAAARKPALKPLNDLMPRGIPRPNQRQRLAAKVAEHAERYKIGRFLGLDHGEERYHFGRDDVFGPMHAAKVPDRWVKTTCGYCSVGCGMLVGIRKGEAVTVRGDPDHPVNRGRLCPKGCSEHLTLRAPGRLTEPLVDGQPATWDAALDRMVTGFRDLVDRYGPESVAVLSTGQLVTEEFYALGKLVRLGMGLAHFDGNTTLCMASAVSGYKLSFGTDGPPGCYEDLDLADVVVLWGANIADNHPLLAPRVLDNQRERGATVIVVDPRVTKTAQFADLHLPVKPRTDVILLNGLIKLLVDEGYVDLDAARAHVEGLDALLEHVQQYPLERVAEECGLPAPDVMAMARAIGQAGAATVAWTMGVNHSVQGTETVTLLNTLCVLTGNVGRPGAAPFSITGQCNAMGTRESGFTASMPGYRAFDDPAHRAELAALWGIDESRLPTERGRAYPDIVNAIASGRIKGLWVIGTNPVVSFPNRETLEFALGRLELLVVQDGFETPTTERADVVLPAAIWGEKSGTFTNSERRASPVRAAVGPIGKARTDFRIFLDVAERWGCRDELFRDWTTPRHAWDEWRTVSAGRPCDYSGASWERIEAAGGVQWPCPADDADLALGGTPRLYTDLRFNRPDGRAALRVVAPAPFTDEPGRDFPFVLNTGRTVEHWHTRTKTGRIPILEAMAPEAWVEINPGDAAALGVRSGDLVRMVSERGAVDRIRARVTAIVRRGEVFVPFHWDERCANRLTNDEFDPISREPNYKQCAVRVEKV